MCKIPFVVGVALVSLISSGACAATIYVDDSVSVSGDGKSWGTAFVTIQEGIDAASEDDAVIVAQATYVENVRLKGRNITLTSTDPLDLTVVSKTIIDGNQTGTVVTFAGTEDATCLLTGFTIRNGKAERGGGISIPMWGNPTYATIRYNVIADNSADFGGGVYNCEGVIQNNVILSNSAAKYGGGLHSCDGVTENNSIALNSAAWSGGGLAFCAGDIRGNKIFSNSCESDGGGLYQCNGSIYNNKIKGNSAWDGGGLYWCEATIRNNTIEENAAAAGGGGLDNCDGIVEDNIISGNTANSAAGLNGCDGVVRDNAIAQNVAEWRGGGLGYCDGLIVGNIIAGNSTTGVGADAGQGSGLFGCDGMIRSNLIAGNSSSASGGGLCWCEGEISNNTVVHNFAGYSGGGLDNCTGPVANCIVWANTAPGDAQLRTSSVPTYSCIQDWTGGGDGNITSDPRFVDSNGPDDNWTTYEDNDYHLLSDSPCIDEGTNSVLTPPGLDMDGNLRIARWKYPLVAIVDMGAYEYGSKPFAVTQFGFTDWPPPGGRYLVWNSQPNDTYAVWSCYTLTGEWYKAGTVASGGETTSFTATGLLPWNWRSLFYRVEME
jgi:hypothetical protein